MTYIGIDPGLGGGIALLDKQGKLLEVHPMPETRKGILRIFQDLGESPRAVVEHVAASPQMGVTSAFTFGLGYGALLMAVDASGILFDTVTPQKWQKFLDCRTKGDKNISKARALELFPQIRITHAIADALLIAEYCRRICLGLPALTRTPGADKPLLS